MDLLSTRSASVLAVFIVIVYSIFLFGGGPTGPEINFIFMLLIGGLIGIAAFRFAANEVKETEGVRYILDLSAGKLVSIFLFAFFIGLGYDGLVLIVIEIFAGIENQVTGTLDISASIMIIIVSFLVIFPFFQFLFLAQPGEDSSIPAEFPIEKAMEKISDIVRSPFIAATLAYSLLYVGPILLLQWIFGGQILQAILLWALVLPLITLGALAGAGLGEDLIRLRLVRNIRDLPKLGLPKINLKELHFDFGGLFLVLFAIQALVTTLFYGFQGLLLVFEYLLDIEQEGGESFLIGILTIFGYLMLTLFNKGRGAFKELKEVWTESGFKVSVFQLFLPVFVFLGVILSSALEVFVQEVSAESTTTGVLASLGLNTSGNIPLVAFFLVLQNFILVGTAIYVFRRTPGAAERRLIKEVPDFYGDDLEGYSYIYNKLKDEKSIENLVIELTRKIGDDPDEIEFLKALLKETIKIKASNVQIVVAEAISIIARKEDQFKQDTYDLTKQVLESDVVGAQIYGVRTLKTMLKHLEGVEKEEAISYLQSFISHPDPVVSWDTSLILSRILTDEPEYRSFVLAKMITSLSETDSKATIEAITQFFKKIAEDSTSIGQMATSTLAVRLSSGDVKNADNLILGVKALLRGNPYLVDDLIDQVAIGIEDEDLESRRQTYQVLINMAEYGTGKEQDILQLIITGIDDPHEDIQKIAYNALTKEVSNAPELIEQIFSLLSKKILDLHGIELIGALNVIEEISKIDDSYHTQIFSLIEPIASSKESEVRALVLKILAKIAQEQRQLGEEIYRIAESNLSHEEEGVRQNAVITMGQIVLSNPNHSRTVYRELSKSREDNSYIVQLAAIEALGYVASASTQLADEIFVSLRPLLEDKDWQVRLAALSGLFAAAQVQRSLVEELVDVTAQAMIDPDRNVRLEVLDITTWLMTNHRSSGEKLVQEVSKNIGGGSDDEFTTMLNTLEIISEYHLLLVPNIVKNLQKAFNKEDNNLRFAANETLKACLDKLKSSRSINVEAKKALNQLVSTLLKGANHSNPKVRRTAYIALTEIAAALPELDIADRCRVALSKAQNLEKDVGLLEYLEEANIRAKQPLDYDFGDRLNYQ